jgi:PHD/YefM family antitoxin component YafN of YafNO toxin-antitoxin module
MPNISSRDFNQNVAGAKRAAQKGPVVITDRGKPSYVLLRHDAYRELLGRGPSIRDKLAHPASDDIDFDPPRLGDDLVEAVEVG